MNAFCFGCLWELDLSFARASRAQNTFRSQFEFCARAPRARRMHSDRVAFGDWVWVLRARPARAECISILIYVLRARPARAECILLGLPLGIGFGFCARAPRSGNGLDGGGDCGGGGVETTQQSNVRISADTGLPYQT